METEINKLKKSYEEITPPAFLEAKGLEDLWLRVDAPEKTEGKFRAFYFSRPFVLAVLVFLVVTGGVGVASAQAKPGSTLYPVKKAVSEAVVEMAHIAPKSLRSNIINLVGPQATPTPTATPGPTIHPSLTPGQEDNRRNNDERQNSSVEKEDSHREVEGASTSAGSKPVEQKTENSNSSENRDHTETNEKRVTPTPENRGQSNSQNQNSGSSLTDSKNQKHSEED